MRYSVLTAAPHRWLVLAVISQAILTLVLLQIPMVREVFGVTMPSSPDLVVIGGFGLVVFVSIEVVKAFLRARTAS
jgi:P-type Ca2+ transporter type 2C